MIKICKACNKEFECYDKARYGHRNAIKRPNKAITCSKKCALLYTSVLRHQEKRNGK